MGNWWNYEDYLMALAAPTSAFGIQNPWILQPRANAPAPTGLQPGGYVAPPAASPAMAWTPPAVAPALPTPPVATPAKPSALSAMAPAIAGLQAGQVGSQAYDTKSGVVSALGAGASGAAAGALAGSVVPGVGTAAGAVVGGGVGLVTGALNAWMTVGKENKANRDRRKVLAEAKAEQNRRDEVARADAVDGLAFERKQIADQKRLEEWQRNRGLLAESAAKSKSRTDEYISRGYTT